MSFIIIVVLVVFADQLSKIAIVATLSLYETVTVLPGFVNLTYVINPGAAFSLFADADAWWRHPFFIAVGVTAIGVLIYLYLTVRKKSPVQGAALALIAGGALGNLVDRVRLGGVVDFIDIYWSRYHWPAFNIADSSICVGVGLFLVLNFVEKDNRSEKIRGEQI